MLKTSVQYFSSGKYKVTSLFLRLHAIPCGLFMASAVTDNNQKRNLTDRKKKKSLTAWALIYLPGKNISVSEISPGLPDLEVEREARGKSPKKLLKENTMKRANPENCV